MVTRITLLSIAAVLGCLSRYGLQGIVQPKDHSFPYGVLAVNALGCLAFGIVAAFVQHHSGISSQTRLIVTTGFLGSFTTFSAYVFDTENLWTHGAMAIAVANAAGQFAVGLGMCIVGLWIGARI